MTNLTAEPGWNDVPQLEKSTVAMGGPDGAMNAQAKALAARTELLRNELRKLSSTAGAAAVGTSDGRSVQDRLDHLPEEVDAAGTAAQHVTQHNDDYLAHPHMSAFITAEANRAELAANQAFTVAGMFATPAAGIAGTTSGQLFAIPGSTAAAALAIYENRDGVAVNTGKELVDGSVIEVIAADRPSNNSYTGAFADAAGNVVLGFRTDGEAHLPKGAATLLTVEEALLLPGSEVTGRHAFPYVEATTDLAGNIVAGIKEDGTNHLPILQSENAQIGSAQVGDTLTMGDGDVLGYHAVVVDVDGNLAWGIKTDGTVHIPKAQIDNTTGGSSGTGDNWHTLDAASSDCIVMLGDSYTASHYTMADKAYISNLSAFLNYRLRNYAISGDNALDINARVVNDTAFFDGTKFSTMQAKYALIATFTNDGSYRTADLTYYQRNLERLIESVRSYGSEPILCSEFPVNTAGLGVLQAVARKTGVRFIDCHSLNNELGQLKVGPFHQGHPGVRTNGVFWLPMLQELLRLPEPDACLKVFRRRPTFVATTSADLLYTGALERYKKFKELSVSHYRLSDATAQYFDELDGSSYSSTGQTSDEYLTLASGGVSVVDYALVEVTLPGTARTLDEVRLSFTLPTGVELSVRDWLDPTANVGDVGNADPDYQAKWNKPRGAWRSLGVYTGQVSLPASSLPRSMDGDKMQLLLYKAGGFTLTSPKVEYRGALGKVAKFVPVKDITNETELLPVNTVAAADLANWVVTGTPTTLIPIDVYNAPRLPTDASKPIVQVCTISASNKIRKTVTLPTPASVGRRYKLTVWARYYAKAFLDNSTYQLDPAQVIDRLGAGVTYAKDSPINSDTDDTRTLRLQYAFSSSITASGGIEVDEFAWLGWRPVEFLIDTPPTPLGSTAFTFELSCPDGEIQIAKVHMKEIMQ